MINMTILIIKGGLRGVVWADVFQSLIMLGGLTIIVIMVCFCISVIHGLCLLVLLKRRTIIQLICLKL